MPKFRGRFHPAYEVSHHNFRRVCNLARINWWVRGILDAHLERARTTTVTKLLQGGADVNVTDDRGDTPLMYAAVGSEAMMRRLIEASADVNAPTAFRPLPSCGAATACPRIRLLVEHGADVNVRSKQGHTPTKVAAHHAGNLEILKLLLSKGASLKVAPDEKGGTALANAADVNDTANRVPHELTAVRRFQAGEFYLRLSQGREIPIQDSSHPQPFRDRLSPAYFAEGDRSRRDHRPVNRKHRLHQLGLYGCADPLRYTPGQVQP